MLRPPLLRLRPPGAYTATNTALGHDVPGALDGARPEPVGPVEEPNVVIPPGGHGELEAEEFPSDSTPTPALGRWRASAGDVGSSRRTFPEPPSLQSAMPALLHGFAASSHRPAVDEPRPSAYTDIRELARSPRRTAEQEVIHQQLLSSMQDPHVQRLQQALPSFFPLRVIPVAAKCALPPL